MARNIFIIGHSRMDIRFDAQGRPSEASSGGQLLTAAITLAGKGYPTYFISEMGRDAVGDQLAATLSEAGVNIKSVDRFTEGTTPTMLKFADGREVWYGAYPEGDMSVVWPRIERGDIVVFGDAYTLEPRVHGQTMDLLRYAHDMKALVIYTPLYPVRYSHLLTHAMPAVLDSYEMASLSIIDQESLNALYHTDNIAAAYRDHMSYYDSPTLYGDSDRLSLFMPTTNDSIDIKVGELTVANIVTAVVESAVELELTAAETSTMPAERIASLLNSISKNL